MAEKSLVKAAQGALDWFENKYPEHMTATRLNNVMRDLRAALTKNANAASQEKGIRDILRDTVRSIIAAYSDGDLDVPLAIADLRAALANNSNAAPQQTVSVGEINEAWKVFKVWFGNADWTVSDAANYRIIFGHGYNFGAARNTAPVAAPQREWQGLTPDEINQCAGAEIYPSSWAITFARAIDSALRTKNEEKNHG